MTDYTAAPACRILATHCCCCNRPLVDAVSVELGIGPDCRKKYMGHGHSKEAQGEANKLVYLLALAISGASYTPAIGIDTPAVQAAFAIGGPKAVGAMLAADTNEGKMIDRIRELGFDKLADKLEKAWMPIRIIDMSATHGAVIAVEAPYLNDEAVSAQRGIPGRVWDKMNKRNLFPASQKAAVWRMLCKFYPGVTGIGPKGPFVVPTAGVPAVTSHAGWLQAARGAGTDNQAVEDAQADHEAWLADRAADRRDETAKAIARGLLTM